MIERKDDGPITVLSMAHGPVNVMDLHLVRAVTDAFRDLAADPPAAVVLTGSGRAFSAGVDLRSYLDGGPDYVAEFLPALSELLEVVFRFPRPVVAAVNGHAIAGGCVLACCADVRLMASGKGRIGVPELRAGVAYPRVALEMLIYTLGAQRAALLVRGADTHPPERAVELGLVDGMVGPDHLAERAIEVATELATGFPADAFALTKKQLRRETVERMTRYRADEDPAVSEIWVRRTQDSWTGDYLASVTGKG
ncbi:MAG: enoyl-CoA hydratase/isomerase family protein [Pseudonocardia sp.]